MTSGTGTATTTFTQAGNANFNPATAVVENTTAQLANQAITVTKPAPANAVYNTNFGVAATSSSGLPVSIAESGVELWCRLGLGDDHHDQRHGHGHDHLHPGRQCQL